MSAMTMEKDEIEIMTNNVPRDIIYGCELTEAEQKEFREYLTEAEINESAFVRYKDQVIHLDEFMAFHPKTGIGEKWDGYRSDSYFSGYLIKIVENGEKVIIATYYS